MRADMTGECSSPRDALRAVAVHHLAGARPVEWVAGSAEDDLALVDLAEAQRVLGSLRDAVDSGAVTLGAPALEHLAARHEAAMRWCLMIEARLLEVREWFDAAGGVRHLVIKGPAIAHLDEATPESRSFADLDLLVAAGDLDRAVAAVASHGGSRPWEERRPGFDRRFAKSVTLASPDRIELDLHRMLCDGVHGVRIPAAQLFASTESFDLGGERVAALSPPHRLLHSAYHAVLGSPTPALHSLRDLAGYLSRPELSPSVIVPTARRWRGEAVLALAVRTTLGELPFRAPEWARWSGEVLLDPAELARIDRQRRDGSSFGRSKVDMWRELPGVSDKAAYALAVAWPSGAHLASRGTRRWRAPGLRPRSGR